MFLESLNVATEPRKIVLSPTLPAHILLCSFPTFDQNSTTCRMPIWKTSCKSPTTLEHLDVSQPEDIRILNTFQWFIFLNQLIPRPQANHFSTRRICECEVFPEKVCPNKKHSDTTFSGSSSSYQPATPHKMQGLGSGGEKGSDRPNKNQTKDA